MVKLLQSEWVASLLGAILYFIVISLTWHPPPAVVEDSAETVATPKYRLTLDPLNPELDQLMEELRLKKAALDTREAQLNQLAVRLQSEREEIDAVTQAVYRIQQQFDASILKVREAETANLKRLAKTYLAMTPEAAAATFKTMDDDSVAKILRTMKEADSAGILEVFSKQGPEFAKRSARIVERMRVAMNEPAAAPAAQK